MPGLLTAECSDLRDGIMMLMRLDPDAGEAGLDIFGKSFS
jgi:hypothetical protein